MVMAPAPPTNHSFFFFVLEKTVLLRHPRTHLPFLGWSFGVQAKQLRRTREFLQKGHPHIHTSTPSVRRKEAVILQRINLIERDLFGHGERREKMEKHEVPSPRHQVSFSFT